MNLLVMVTCLQLCAGLIALPEKGIASKDINTCYMNAL